MESIKTLNYVSEITGSGKTNNVLNRVAKSKDKYILAFPTRELCNEIHQYLVMRGVIDGVDVIHSLTTPVPSKEIAKVMVSKQSTRIILTTHASLRLCINEGIIGEMSDWHLIVDEEMEFFRTHEFNVSEHSAPLLDAVIDVVSYDDTFYRIVPTSDKLWDDILSGKSGDTFMDHPKLVDIVSYSASPQYITLIPKAVYDRYHVDVASLKDGKFKKLYAMSILHQRFFNAFKDITVLCSFYEHTISHRMLDWIGVPTQRMVVGKTAQSHANSELINIHYYTNANWTQTLKRKEIRDPNGRVSIEEYVRNNILSKLTNKAFIYTSNKNLRGKAYFGSGTLVTSIHGVNSYINHTNMVYMQSLNATGSEVNLLSYFGIARKEVDFARTVLGAYQFISRGAVRKTNNKETITVFVMDKRTVDFLLKVFPKANVTYHETDAMIIEELRINRPDRPTVPPKVRAMVSRVRRKLRAGEDVRQKTLDRYNNALRQFYI